jgi:hypothetical protein
MEIEKTSTNTRRHDVDSLRNLALLLLILYHLGMYYVADWSWHIKSDHQSVWLQNIMVMSNLWRMCLLFFISGITLALIDNKYTSGSLFYLRFKRLFVPLVFGMAVIVPPQLYYELVASGQYSGGYASFFIEYMKWDSDVAPEKQSPILGLWTWNHLWYLIYLFVYTMVFLLLRPLVRRCVKSNLFNAMHPLLLAFLFAFTLLNLWVFIRPNFPTTHGLLDDWWSHAKYLLVMFAGFALANRMDIWNRVIQKRRVFILSALLTYSLIALDRNGAFPFMAEAFREHLWVQFAYGAVVTANVWSWILGLTGYAGKYLNKSSTLLRYANQAVLPWYILHQSLIIVFAANIAALNLPEWIEALSILSLTIISSFLAFEVIRRIHILRFLFGLK